MKRRFWLPPKIFLYTLEQVADLLALDEDTLASEFSYFEGRSIGRRKKDRLSVRNIAPLGETPRWRISEQELVRWCTHKGYAIYDASVLSDFALDGRS